MQEDTSHILVSVVVPIYNPGQRLVRCLDSLCGQSLENMEILCVLDCPTDGSEQIAERYAAQDKRFRLVYNAHNMGVGESRNAGVAEARGEYVGFCDDDDYIAGATYYEDLYRTAKQQEMDVVSSSVVVEYADHTETIGMKDQTTTYTQLQSLLYPEYAAKCLNRLARSVWHSIYRREFLQDHAVRFYDRRTHLEEDTLFNVQVYTQTDRYASLQQAYYHWDLTAERTAANYRSTFDIQALKAFFTVVQQAVTASNLLDEKQKQNLLSDCLSAQFYTKYCAFRNEDNRAVVALLGSDLRYVQLHSVCRVCCPTFETVRRQWVMLIKFGLYIEYLRSLIR